MSAAPRTFRLILWPSVITLAITAVRLLGEVEGWINVDAGGAFALLGITWCVFVFGGWFGLHLARAGSVPRVTRAPLWLLLLALAIMAVAGWQFGGLDRKDTSDAAFELLREKGLIVCVCALVAMLVTFALWPRQAWTMLCYGVVARLGVLAATWLAKHQGWETHHVKFGPAQIQRESMADTMIGAAFPQLLFWVPFTVVMGTLTGSLFARRRPTAI